MSQSLVSHAVVRWYATRVNFLILPIALNPKGGRLSRRAKRVIIINVFFATYFQQWKLQDFQDGPINTRHPCSAPLAVCSGAQCESPYLMCTHTHTESGLSCYCVQGYGSPGLFGLVSWDFLALSDSCTEGIEAALNLLQASSYLAVGIVCVCVCVCVCVYTSTLLSKV